MTSVNETRWGRANLHAVGLSEGLWPLLPRPTGLDGDSEKVIWSLSKTLSNALMGKRAVLGRMRNDSAGVILGQKILLTKFFNEMLIFLKF
jgi:hypothetical protein